MQETTLIWHALLQRYKITFVIEFKMQKVHLHSVNIGLLTEKRLPIFIITIIITNLN